MRKIVLLCSAGMSTSMLIKKMEESARKVGYEVSVEAHSVSSANTTANDADLVLLGPQVRFYLDQVKKQLPDKPVEVIDMRAYGTLNGDAIIAQVRKALGEE